MPRNTQVTRILHVLRQLEVACGVTLDELAAALPPDYPKNLRTLRRDLEAIESVGFPVVTERADGRTRLMRSAYPYQLPLDFDVEAYVQDALVVMRGRPVTVELEFDRPTAAWVRDRQWHPSQALKPSKGGRLRMTLRVADTPELVGWILSFGAGVRVLRPEDLREKVRPPPERFSRPSDPRCHGHVVPCTGRGRAAVVCAVVP